MTEEERIKKVMKLNERERKKNDQLMNKIQDDLNNGKITKEEAIEKFSKIKITFYD